MARKTRKRTMAVRISLTNKAYKQVEIAAFKNCRTVSQELTYMVERQLVVHGPIKTYDAPTCDDPKYDSPDQNNQSQSAFISNGHDLPWTQEQEYRIGTFAKEANISEAQLTALKFLHKTPEDVIEAIKSETGIKV